MVLLSLSAVRKAFGTNEVIRDATLALQEGEKAGPGGREWQRQNHAAEDHQRRYAIRRGEFPLPGTRGSAFLPSTRTSMASFPSWRSSRACSIR